MGNGRLAGILSERDCVRSIARATRLPTDIAVREAMRPCEAFASSTDSLQQCLRVMLDEGLHYLPILESSSPIGLLSLEDLLREMLAYLEKIFKESEVDQRIVNLSGTYSC